jgi:hypothetical protein
MGNTTRRVDAPQTKQNTRGAVKMKRLKLLGLALIAIFALSAMATTAAFAENPLILPNPTAKEPLTFTSESVKGTKPKLETTKGTEIKCEKAKNSGSFTTGDAGTIEIDFEGCSTPVGAENVSCNSPGDKKGIILLNATNGNGDIQLVDVLPEIEKVKKLRLGVLITLLSDLNIECSLVKIKVLQSVIGLADIKGEPTTEEKLIKTNVMTLLFHQTKGEQEIKECDLLIATCGKEGARKKFLLEANFGAGHELAGEEAEAVVTFAKEAEFHY